MKQEPAEYVCGCSGVTGALCHEAERLLADFKALQPPGNAYSEEWLRYEWHFRITARKVVPGKREPWKG